MRVRENSFKFRKASESLLTRLPRASSFKKGKGWESFSSRSIRPGNEKIGLTNESVYFEMLFIPNSFILMNIVSRLME